MNEGEFDPKKLIIVEPAHHEPVVLGDFVYLNSGSPLGLVTDEKDGFCHVKWIGQNCTSDLPSACLRPHFAAV